MLYRDEGKHMSPSLLPISVTVRCSSMFEATESPSSSSRQDVLWLSVPIPENIAQFCSVLSRCGYKFEDQQLGDLNL